MDNVSSQFLDTITAIETWMRSELNAAPKVEFWRLVDDMTDNTPGFSRYAGPLKAFAEVRNLIVHRYSREQPLAVPSAQSLRRLLAIKEQLLSPPSLLSLAAKPVEQCQPTDPLGCCVKKMHDGVFSQLPIYDGEKYFGLLTAETIARWLATEFVGDWKGIVDEKSVAEVMRHQEDSENVQFSPRTATVADGLAAFDDFLHRGRRLEAILVTNTGHPTETLLGIVTIHDIPKLNQAING
jgi:predicted transcriptional regulator